MTRHLENLDTEKRLEVATSTLEEAASQLQKLIQQMQKALAIAKARRQEVIDQIVEKKKNESSGN